MLTQIRHIQKGTLIVVTIIIVIAFAFLYSDFDFSGSVGTDRCAVKAYDRCYRGKEVKKLASYYDVSTMLGMGEFANVLSGVQRSDQNRFDFVLSLIILRAEAEKLGIEPSAEEIKSAIPKLPIFQQPWVTAQFIENNVLGPNGFTDGDLAQLVKDYLSFQKLRDLIGNGVAAIPSETNSRYVRGSQNYTASAIEFDREKVSKDIKITAEEIAEYFEENSETLLSDPQRGFQFARFEPIPLGDDVTNEQRSKSDLAFAQAVNRAYADLAAKDADFVEVAKQYAGKKADFVMTKGAYEPFSLASSPPKELEGNDVLLGQIFSGVFQEGNVTVPIATEEGGYFVFCVSELVEPQPLTEEQAKSAIEQALLAKKSNRAVSDAANAARAALNEALESGKTFAEAAKAAKVTPESLPVFSAREPLADRKDGNLILSAVSSIGENTVSEVVEKPGGEGYLLVYIDKIELYEDPEEDSMKRSIAASTEAGLRRTLFSSWFNQRKLASTSSR
tara:strand:+ start:155 stop:1666 length:1512 start_codon:yes stop_codon:yes gene_type:complete